MTRADITNVLETIKQDIEAISDERVKSIQKTLLNLIEMLLKDNEELRAENQRLRNENNRLKGEQGNQIYENNQAIKIFHPKKNEIKTKKSRRIKRKRKTE